MSFGENLQFYRAREGMTQEELAERLAVSRQSVSKWESNTSFPEMEKLMILCSLFHTDLDTLVRGDAQALCQEDTLGYDRHMNAFSNAVAGGVGLILLGIAAALGLYGLAGMPDTWCGAVILTAIAVAVAILVVAGMNHDRYVQQHPILPPIYTPAQRETYARRFPYLIALPIAAILIGVVWLILLASWAEAGGDRREAALVSGFLLDLALSVSVLVWAGMRMEKYEIENWNREHDPSPEAKARRKKIDRICGTIMLVATALFLAVGFGGMALANDYGSSIGWRWGWIVYPIAGVLCALVSHLLDDGDEAE